MDTLARTPLPEPQVHTASTFLPPEAPLAMVVRPLRQAQNDFPYTKAANGQFTLRRVGILLSTLALTAAGAYEMYQVLQVGGVTVLEACVLVLYVSLFAWIAFSFVSAFAGFVVLLFRKRDPLGINPRATLPTLTGTNAMLLPTYNEDPSRIAARLQSIYESVNATGNASHFDWYILSDSTDPEIWIAEEKCFLRLVAKTGTTRIFYRHRLANTARKSGNISDWVRRFGARYDHMIILDADSLMTGDAIVRLAGAMERHPRVALIQTLPMIVNAKTLFARLQQFAGRLYGPLIATGIAWWHGSEGNYWGHNAIIRVCAFAEQAGLPELAGRKPFGGHILSHDFVEAALMRRAGWAIHMAPTLGGSFEECPPSLVDYAARDRRWCQGNLQHLAVLPARGLHWVSRLHLLTGIGSYLTAPLWLMFLVFGILISLQAHFVRPEYFPHGISLFPQWPAQDPVRAAWVFAGTMALLIVPKLLAYVLLLTQPSIRKQFGGGVRTFIGILLETLLSGLIAPVMMIFQSAAVVSILSGRDAGWQVQRRDDGHIPTRELVHRYAMPTLVGAAMAASAYAVSLSLFFWMLPVILGLLLAIPIAMVTSTTSSSRPGVLLVIPEEVTPPLELTRANELFAAAPNSTSSAIQLLRNDAALLEAHLATLPTTSTRARGQVDPDLAIARAKIEDAEDASEAISYLTARETFAVLSSRTLLSQLVGMPDNATDL